MRSVPRHPQPSFFETTVVETPHGVVTHKDIEAILARPPWSFAEADKRIRREMRKAQVQKVGGRTKAAPRPKKPAAKKS